jgi:hypothetical protein
MEQNTVENLNDFEFKVENESKESKLDSLIEKKGIMSAFFTPREIKNELDSIIKENKESAAMLAFAETLIKAFKSKYPEIYAMVQELEGENLIALAQYLNSKTTIKRITKDMSLKELEIKGRVELLEHLETKGLISKEDE